MIYYILIGIDIFKESMEDVDVKLDRAIHIKKKNGLRKN